MGNRELFGEGASDAVNRYEGMSRDKLKEALARFSKLPFIGGTQQVYWSGFRHGIVSLIYR